MTDDMQKQYGEMIEDAEARRKKESNMQQSELILSWPDLPEEERTWIYKQFFTRS